jgi:hypothetical protein
MQFTPARIFTIVTASIVAILLLSATYASFDDPGAQLVSAAFIGTAWAAAVGTALFFEDW